MWSSLNPFIALGMVALALRAEAITACRGKTTQWGSLEFDLRIKSKPIPSGPTIDFEINGISQQISQGDCRDRVPSLATRHCWERKAPPRKPTTPTKPPGKPPKGGSKPPAHWEPNYQTAAGMQIGPTAKCTMKTTIPDYTCDHILELNFLQRVLEQPGGACELALAAATTEFRYKKAMGNLRDVRHVMNNWQNLALHQGKTTSISDPTSAVFGGTPEDFKTKTVQSWVRGVSITEAAADVWKLGGLDDYINTREKKVLVDIGSAVDAKIGELFTGATVGLHDEWRRFQLDVKTAFDGAVTAHKAQLAAEAQAEEDCKKAAAEGGGTGGGTGTGISVRRLARRHAFGASGDKSLWPTSGGIISSLTRRARHAAPRTGPKAPRAKSCPCKQVPAKKQVPRSKVKQRPMPAKTPRQPKTRPAARKPARPKQVAKRPANRPRRVPGKQATVRRPSPRRKPKTVPRPTRKPKGKPRARRGRR
ncbi:hypothetical protein BKA62DRAFT_698966 [Auriculariales sp. MPI-PUGE-AT-0066]|nr:hypothetical protein BKA62DRAFT_698966 [Auriculariales sp. MPI-PUGE-AT-0066]